MSRVLTTIMSCLAALPAALGEGADMDRWDAIRGFAAEAPALEPTMGPAPPKYQVIRLNTISQTYDGDRYGVVRLKLPSAEPYTLVVLFADVGNIVEYEIMPVAKGAAPLRGNTRLIHPAFADHDHEEEPEPLELALPKPWDHFELHLLGFAPDLIKSTNEYLIWFRFTDKQPADVLLAATLLKGPVDLAPEKLPRIFELPEHKHE